MPSILILRKTSLGKNAVTPTFSKNCKKTSCLSSHWIHRCPRRPFRMQSSSPLQRCRRTCSCLRRFRRIGRIKMEMHWRFIFISRQWKDQELASWAHSCISLPKISKVTMIFSKWQASCRNTLRPWSRHLWSRRIYLRKLRRKFWRVIKDKRLLGSILREMSSGNRNWPLLKSPRVLADSGPGSRRNWARRSS